MHSFLVATLAVYVVLAAGPVAVRAESLPADPGGLEYATVPPVVDASVEPAVPAGGSVAVPSTKLMARPEPEAWGEADPWADAVQDAARLTSPAPHTHL